MPDNIVHKPLPPLKDRLIPWYFVMAFGVVFAVNMVFVFLAVKKNVGVVIDTPYEKGLEYNKTIEKAKIQEALGWQSEISYDNKILRLTLTNMKNQPLQDAVVKAYLRRPIQSKYDVTLPMEEKENGTYETNVEFPLPGQWEVTVNVIWQNQQYQNSKRLIVR